jgi:hypothetical protein
LRITNWAGPLALSPQKDKSKRIRFQLQDMVTPNVVGKQEWASEWLTAKQTCEGKLLTLILPSDCCQMLLKGKMYVDSGGVRKAPARMLRAQSAIIPQRLYCTVLSSGHVLRDLFLCFSFRKHATQLPQRHNNRITKSHFAAQFNPASRRLTH